MTLSDLVFLVMLAFLMPFATGFVMLAFASLFRDI